MINRLFVHHTGGIGQYKYASSAHLTFENINNAHRDRWPNFKSLLGEYGGYNIAIRPDGEWHQFRMLGEETAAQKGYNETAFSIALIGNFTINPATGSSVDNITSDQIKMFEQIALAILEKRTDDLGIKKLPNVDWNIPIQNVGPHRLVNPTDCYGGSLSDNWARNILTDRLQISLRGKIILLIQQLIDLLTRT